MTDSILWRRLDRPGNEAARLVHAGSDWRLRGAAVFLHDGEACRLDYEVVCDRGWYRRSARVSGWVGDDSIEIETPWTPQAGGDSTAENVSKFAGCTDLDLNFSPSTNLLPIRCLDLAIGQEAPVRAAWLRFPSFSPSRSTSFIAAWAVRTTTTRAPAGKFTAELEVDASGFVTRYPGFAEPESG